MIRSGIMENVVMVDGILRDPFDIKRPIKNIYLPTIGDDDQYLKKWNVLTWSVHQPGSWKSELLEALLAVPALACAVGDCHTCRDRLVTTTRSIKFPDGTQNEPIHFPNHDLPTDPIFHRSCVMIWAGSKHHRFSQDGTGPECLLCGGACVGQHELTPYSPNVHSLLLTITRSASWTRPLAIETAWPSRGGRGGHSPSPTPPICADCHIAIW